jgi:hypothetical protein
MMHGALGGRPAPQNLEKARIDAEIAVHMP